MLTTDQRLTLRYKEMFGLDNIDNTSGNTTLQGNVYVTNRFDVFGNAIIMSDTSCNSLLTVNGNNLFNNNTTVNSIINISGSTILNNNVSIGSDLSISGNTNIFSLTSVSNKTMLHNTISIGSSLYVAGAVRFGSNFKSNMLRSIGDNPLNINCDTINFGTQNTNIYIKGTTINLITNELKINDKLITLNIDPITAEAFDDGSLSGLEILSNNNNVGYIKSSEDGKRYKIKAPQDDSSWYIATTDNNNNLDVSGNSMLNSYVTISSLLYVSGKTTLQGNTTFNTNLNISGTALLQGESTLLSKLNISGGTILQGYTTIKSVLTVKENLFINGASTINSKLYISGNTNINGELTIASLLNINGNTLILGNITVNSRFFVSDKTTIAGNTTILSSITISGNTNINSDTNIFGSIVVSGNTILNNNSTINSQLLVNGTSNLNNNISVSSNFNIVSNIISNIPEYENNLSAKNGGVSLWGLYRTGGIVKIRIDDEAPALTLLGDSTLSFAYQQSYNDPGILATDNVDNNILVYLVGIYTNNTNLLSNNILITGTSSLITQTSLLLEGLYTAKYQATDSNYNTSYIYRNLNLIDQSISLINYTSSNYLLTWKQSTGTPQFTTNPYTLFLYRYMAFAIQPSILTSINFNFNSSWCFVIKTQRTSTLLDNYFNLSFDGPLVNWGPNINYGMEEGPVNLLFKGSDYVYYGNEFRGTYTNFTNLWANGVYIASSYDYINKFFNVKVYDYSGNLLINLTSINQYNYTYRVSPVYFYTNEQTCYFYNGMYYNLTTNNVSFSSFVSYFS